MTTEKLTVDNRDASEMHMWHEARIEALKRRIAELEADKAALQDALSGVCAECSLDITELGQLDEALRKAVSNGR